MGRPPKDPRDHELERLSKENLKLRDQLRKASLVIDVQKKISQLFDLKQPSEEEILRSEKQK